jgi:nucleoid DNA-binding protein
MTKKQLIRSIAADLGVSQKLVEDVLTRFVEILKDTFLHADDPQEKYIIHGFGTFYIKKYTSIKKIGTSIQRTIKFRISEYLKEELNS